MTKVNNERTVAISDKVAKGIKASGSFYLSCTTQGCTVTEGVVLYAWHVEHLYRTELD